MVGGMTDVRETSLHTIHGGDGDPHLQTRVAVNPTIKKITAPDFKIGFSLYRLIYYI
jgi:hypothetical protein